MPVQYVAQRVTFFADDDVTALLGTADASGNVIDPSFSTDKTHARPYLMFQPETGSAEIDFAEGRSSIGQVNLVIGDKRLDPDDQASGVYTQLQASGVTGDTQVLRRRVLWEGQDLTGAWVVLMNGVLYRTTLNSDLVSYTIALRDMRERERRVRLFVENEGTAIFPRIGPRDGWGQPYTYDPVTQQYALDPWRPAMLAPVAGAVGTFKLDLLAGSCVVIDFDDALNVPLINPTQELRDIWTRYGQSVLDGQEIIGPGDAIFSSLNVAFDRFRYKNVIAEWSGDGGTTWNRLSTMPASTGIVPFRQNVFEIITIPPLYGQSAFDIVLKGEAPRPAFDVIRSVMLVPSPGDVSPVNGQRVLVRYLSNLPPEKDVPKYLEETSFGTLLRKVYDGEFSDVQVPPRVQYSETAMAAMEVSTMPAIGIIDGVVTDMRGWVEENIYKPNGYAPALDPSGMVTPIKYELPSASAPLLELTDAIVESAEWEHSDALAVNKVSFVYQRDIVPTTLSYQNGYRIITSDVTIEDWNIGSASLFNSKTLEYRPVTCHTVLIGGTSVFAQTPSLVSEIGWRLAMARCADVLRRFGSGAQLCKVTAKASDAGVYAAQAGDWVILGVSWLPDYQSRRRGINRLMQITKVKKSSPITREFTLVDAGPYDQPAALPTVGNIQEGANSTVTVDVTAIPAGVTARLEFAVSPTEPVETSGAWMAFARTTTLGTFSTSPVPPGSTVWVRWRGEIQGRRSSDWGGPLTITVGGTAIMLSARLDILVGVPRIQWSALDATTLGVRVYYQRHANGTAQPAVLASSIDAAVDNNGAGGDGYVDLPFTLDPLEQVTVQVVGYPGFAGGAVTGAAGFTSQKMTAQYLGAVLNAPTIAYQVTSVAPYVVADVALTPANNGNEKITVWVRDEASMVPYILVVANGDPTPRYVVSGTALGPADWFYNGTIWTQALNDIPIPSGMTVRRYVMAIGQVSGKDSDWVPIVIAGQAATQTQLDTLAAAKFVTTMASSALSDEQVVADSTTVAFDASVPGVAKWYVPDLGITPAKLAAGATTPSGTKAYFGDGTWKEPVVAGGSGTGAVSSYTEVNVVTSSIANDASATVIVTMAKTIALQRIVANAACWIRLYQSLAALNADIARGDVDPAYNESNGHLFDAAPGVSGAGLTLERARDLVLHNNENPRSGKYFARITNKSGAAVALNITFRYLPLEATPATVPPDVTGGGLIYRFNVLTEPVVADGTEQLSVANTGSLGGTFTNASTFGSGPRYKTNRINGHPAITTVSIGGNTRPYGTSVAVPTAGVTEAHIFAVIRTLGGGSGWDVGPGGTVSSFPNGAGNVADQFASTTSHNVPISSAASGILYHAHSSSSIWEAYVGLTQVFQTAVNTFSWGTVLLGGYFAGGFLTTMGDNDLGEIRIYTGPLSDDDILGIKTQMALDWGVSL